jgi:L-galactose dehydrogenase
VRYRKLGITGLEVSVIGFGASPLGNVFGDVSPSASTQAVHAAIDRGINLFDVSPYYGLTLAEERLGEALVGKRSSILVGTKCGRYGQNEFDFSARSVTVHFEQSLRRLRTDYVDLLQAHDVEFGSSRQILEETIPAMLRLKEQGKARFIGLTGYWPGSLARLAAEAHIDCVLNYCHANLFVDDMNRELVPFAEQTGIGLLNASPLHMGLLGDKPIPEWHPAPQRVQDAAREVRSLCKIHAVDPAMLGLRICLDIPAVASTLVGISSESEVDAACAALDWTPPSSLLEAVRKIVAPVHNALWPSVHPENQSLAANMMGDADVAR